MSRAFISWTTALQRDLAGPFGKFATLYFDEVVFQVPRHDLISQLIDSLVERHALSESAGRALRDVWQPVQAVLPDYEFLKQPWHHEDNRLVELAESVAVEETRKEYPEIQELALRHEVGWMGAGLIEAVGTWAVLHAKDACALLADPAEARVVEGVFATSMPPTDHALFSQALMTRLSGPGDVSWDHVFGLRSSTFVEAFRKKISQLDRLIKESDNRRDIGAILDEFERRDLRELALTVKPDAKSAWARALTANVPLPIPVNPVAIALSAADLKGTYERRKRFGWLYFLLEFDSMPPNLGLQPSVAGE